VDPPSKRRVRLFGSIPASTARRRGAGGDPRAEGGVKDPIVEGGQAANYVLAFELHPESLENAHRCEVRRVRAADHAGEAQAQESVAQDSVPGLGGKAFAPALANQRVQDLDFRGLAHPAQSAEADKPAGLPILGHPLTKAHGGEGGEARRDQRLHRVSTDHEVIPEKAAHIGLGEERVQGVQVLWDEGPQHEPPCFKDDATLCAVVIAHRLASASVC